MPLAYDIRPKTFDDIIGQDNLVGKNGIIRLMCDKNKLHSLILFGPPGCGKTTIARIIKEKYKMESFSFNASTDSKQVLKDIADSVKIYNRAIVIIDEIHRMKKDTQDFLLPYTESGKIIIIGLTTENPYIAINPAIRSRCQIYKMETIKESDIFELLKKTSSTYDMFKHVKISDEILDYIVKNSGLEIRTALNMLETLSLYEGEVTIDMAQNACGIKAMRLDSKSLNYYDLLSALQKSIRGSDVDASLIYLAKLIKLGDLDIIIRRLSIIAYEDIGLANPQVASYVESAVNVALRTGLPEARIPLSAACIMLALSPKSNSAESAIDKALSDIESFEFDIPSNILNREIKGNSSLYKYPHDYPNDIVEQNYIPKVLKGHTYYTPKETGKYERAIKEYRDYANKILKK